MSNENLAETNNGDNKQTTPSAASGATTPGTTERSVTVWPESEVHDDFIAEEVAIAISYNGISHVVMMATPTDLKHFALGFSFSEGIIETLDDVFDLTIQETDAGIEVDLEISLRRFNQLKNRKRQLSGKTGCGICGIESLQMMERNFSNIHCEDTFSHRAIQRTVNFLDSQQTLQELTGATHAAAWCDSEGNILHIAEDVGRHNALDKLVGVLLEKEIDTCTGFVFISSRVSYEMAQKTIAIGAPLLVGASAPTSLALSEADKYGLCIVGFARPGRQVIYTQADRIIES